MDDIWGTSWWYFVSLGLAMVPQKLLNGTPTRAGALFSGSQGARLEGRGKVDLPKFDEPGYIAQRICLWGMHPPFEFPPLVSGETLWVKAVTNNTYGHHGEMALPQMLLASFPKTE